MSEEFEGQEYRDDRVYVMRIASNFTKESDGTVFVESRAQIKFDFQGPVLLITYRNLQSLPATRSDEFSSLSAAIEYIKQIEPTCPRISFDGRPPYPTPSWSEHLGWLDSRGLRSAAEGDTPTPHWVNDENNPREMLVIAKK